MTNTAIDVVIVGAGPRSILTRILDDEALLATVRSLEPPALARLVRHVGLEDAGELIALASPEQLMAVLDEDLWQRERPGEDEVFDARRFSQLLEVMLELGADRAADRLTTLDEDLVTHGLCQLVLVLDVDELTTRYWGQGEDDGLSEAALVDKALESSLSFELDRYLLVARAHDGWDALLALLTSLDNRHPAVLARLLERCCAVSTLRVEDEGLHHVLDEAESLAEDVADAREQRRTAEGFVSPAAARSLLALALIEPIGDDVITRDYFRRLRPPPARERSSLEEARWLTLLRELEPTEPSSTRPRLTDGREAKRSPLRAALERLRAEDPDCFERRSAELAFVANVLLAGSQRDGRPYRPIEAAEDALALSEAGLAHVLDGASDEANALAVLHVRSVVSLFGFGWRRHKEESRADPSSSL